MKPIGERIKDALEARQWSSLELTGMRENPLLAIEIGALIGYGIAMDEAMEEVRRLRE